MRPHFSSLFLAMAFQRDVSAYVTIVTHTQRNVVTTVNSSNLHCCAAKSADSVGNSGKRGLAPTKHALHHRTSSKPAEISLKPLKAWFSDSSTKAPPTRVKWLQLQIECRNVKKKNVN